MIEILYPLFLILLILYGMIISIVLYLRISKLHKQKTREGINYMVGGLNVFIALFTNEYKEDKLYNNLVWQLRIIIPLILILAFIAGVM